MEDEWEDVIEQCRKAQELCNEAAAELEKVEEESRLMKENLEFCLILHERLKSQFTVGKPLLN